jgi:HPt (histidine-containing phosphotransfer) domain-containing protein
VNKILNMAALLECFANDKDFIADLLKTYESDAKASLPNLETAIREKDAKKVISTSHSLKGISANMHLEPLRDVFLRLEQMGKQDNLTEADVAFEEARNLFAQFEQEYHDQLSIKI